MIHNELLFLDDTIATMESSHELGQLDKALHLSLLKLSVSGKKMRVGNLHASLKAIAFDPSHITGALERLRLYRYLAINQVMNQSCYVVFKGVISLEIMLHMDKGYLALVQSQIRSIDKNTRIYAQIQNRLIQTLTMTQPSLHMDRNEIDILSSCNDNIELDNAIKQNVVILKHDTNDLNYDTDINKDQVIIEKRSYIDKRSIQIEWSQLSLNWHCIDTECQINIKTQFEKFSEFATVLESKALQTKMQNVITALSARLKETEITSLSSYAFTLIKKSLTGELTVPGTRIFNTGQQKEMTAKMKMINDIKSEIDHINSGIKQNEALLKDPNTKAIGLEDITRNIIEDYKKNKIKLINELKEIENEGDAMN